MTKFRSALLAACLVVGAPVLTTACTSMPDEVSRADIDSQSTQALNRLTADNSAAKAIASKARAVLIFPSIVKAGLGVGGAYGEGEMRKSGVVQDYYSTSMPVLPRTSRPRPCRKTPMRSSSTRRV